MSKETLIRDLEENGKKENITWLEYAIKHDIKLGGTKSQRRKCSNDIWRNWRKVTFKEDSGLKDFLDKNSFKKNDDYKKNELNIGEYNPIDVLNIKRQWIGNYCYLSDPINTDKKTDEYFVYTKSSQGLNILHAIILAKNYQEAYKIFKSNYLIPLYSLSETKLPDILDISLMISSETETYKEKKIDSNVELKQRDLIEEIKKHSPSYDLTAKYEAIKDDLSKKIKARKSSKKMLEISIPDLHIGKRSNKDECGEDYNSDIACKRYKDAVYEILSRVDVHSIDKILLPIGNDMINIDNKLHTTTAGTPQYGDNTYISIFNKVKNLLVEVIDGLTLLCSVDIIIVPGNHDEVSCYQLGAILEAYYHNNILVNVNNDPKPRKYYQYGVNGIMLTHGNNERHNDLGLLFATEQPMLWADTKFRESQLGHFHKTKTTKYVDLNEEVGFKVRIMPSLSGTDNWHYSKGYFSNKCAKGLLYDYDNGLIAEYNYNL